MRWVIKIGSALLTNNGQGFNLALVESWAAQIAKLRQQNIDIILVSSGAITEGMQRLKWRKRPTDMHQLQAAAAVGQMGLVQTYESLFFKHDIHTAQLLLTHDNIANTEQNHNVFATLDALLRLSVLPIINENDTVATDEIKFGDNDTLAALVTNLTGANRLIILTEQGGIYDEDPRQSKDAKLIEKIHIYDPVLNKVSSRAGGPLGSGGMYTKILAAKTAAKSGANTVIVSGKQDSVLTKIGIGEMVGTLIHC